MPNSGNAVTRVELYDAVYRRVGLSRSESASLVELVLTEITDSMARGETVKNYHHSGLSLCARKQSAWVEIQRQA
jgi:nucleoid DNA-binding protein